jgi:hypothetical protein
LAEVLVEAEVSERLAERGLHPGMRLLGNCGG